VRTYKVVFDGLLDLRHVAGNTLATRTSPRMMGMLAHGAARSSRIFLCVAEEAKRVSWHLEIRCVGVAVYLMAVEAAKPTMVHVALNEVVPLHPVLVRSLVGVLIKVCRSMFCLFEPPIISETFSGQEANGPVIVLVSDGIGERASLAVALHARVVAAHIVECLWIDDVLSCRMRDVGAAWTVTLFAANIPLSYLLCFNVVVD